MCFLKGAWSCLSQNIDVEGTPLFFCPRGVVGPMCGGAGRSAEMQNIENVQVGDFTEPTAVIRLTSYYRPGIEHERFALYEATRAHWSTKKDHQITATKIALAVHDGVVLEVYQIAAWVPANSTMMYFRMDNGDKERMEFVGNIAKPSTRKRFLGKSVANLFSQGDIRPVACFGI